MNKRPMTLCIIHEDDRVLLGMKKRGFGEGRWNGFGGKVEDDEDIEEALQRELQEEAGIRVDSVEKHGLLHFHLPDEEEIIEVHIFIKEGIF